MVSTVLICHSAPHWIHILCVYMCEMLYLHGCVCFFILLHWNVLWHRVQYKYLVVVEKDLTISKNLPAMSGTHGHMDPRSLRTDSLVFYSDFNLKM